MTRQQRRLKKIQENLRGFKENLDNSKIANRSTEQQCCQGKNPYNDWEFAKRIAKRQSKETGLNLQPYKCPYCHKIHIGHKKKNVEISLGSIENIYADGTAHIFNEKGNMFLCSCIYKLLDSKQLFKLIILKDIVSVNLSRFETLCKPI